MFMVLSSWQSHFESSPGSFDECRTAPSGRRPQSKPNDLDCESACRLPESTPTIAIYHCTRTLHFICVLNLFPRVLSEKAVGRSALRKLDWMYLTGRAYRAYVIRYVSFWSLRVRSFQRA